LKGLSFRAPQAGIRGIESGRNGHGGQIIHCYLGIASRREQQSQRKALQLSGDMIVAAFRREPRTSARTIQDLIGNMRHSTTSLTGSGMLPEAASIVLIWINGPAPPIA
jgi:hypothetical protein